MALESVTRFSSYYLGAAYSGVAGAAGTVYDASSRYSKFIARGIVTAKNIRELENIIQSYEKPLAGPLPSRRTPFGSSRVTNAANLLSNYWGQTLDLRRIAINDSSIADIASIFSNHGCPSSIKKIVFQVCSVDDAKLINERLSEAFSEKSYRPEIILARVLDRLEPNVNGHYNNTSSRLVSPITSWLSKKRINDELVKSYLGRSNDQGYYPISMHNL